MPPDCVVTLSCIDIRLSRVKLAGPPTPRDTEASNAYAILHDLRGPGGMCSFIGISSIVVVPHRGGSISLRPASLDRYAVAHYTPRSPGMLVCVPPWPCGTRPEVSP